VVCKVSKDRDAFVKKCQTVYPQHLKRRYALKDLRVDGRVIFIFTLNIFRVVGWINLAQNQSKSLVNKIIKR
jgi:hypothetical protein